jgi:hypothetical protein
MSKYLYRKTPVYRKAGKAARLAMALLALAFCAHAPYVEAQYLVPPPERTTPRALAVLETYKNGSRRLIPVTFFFEKHYFDAGLYHATPVPFTLYSETLYEVLHFGKPLGTFTVQSATMNPGQNSVEWFGNGRFKPVPDAATLARKKKPQHVVVDDPSRPVLHRREGSEGDNPPAHPREVAAKTDADEDPDRPKLHRRQGSDTGDAPAQAGTAAGGNAAGGNGASSGTPSGASSGTPSGASAGGNASASPANSPSPAPASQSEESSGQDPNRPKLQRKDGSGSATPSGSTASASTTNNSPTASASDPPSTQGASPSSPAASPVNQATQANAGTARAELRPSDDPDHPILRRGKPVQEQGGHDLPDLKLEEPVARQVAVSDAGPAGSTEGQELIYVCPEPERQRMEESARELARAELRRLAVQRGLVLPAPAVAPSAGARARKNAALVKPLDLKDEQFVPYDLDYNNYATVFYSARYEAASVGGASGSSATQAVAQTGAKGKSWVVTVIARPDSDGKLIKLYSAVSDPRELDLYPEVRLVDAVDPDGYGRHVLLLREKKRDGVSWMLGRVTGYEMQNLFETSAR